MQWDFEGSVYWDDLAEYAVTFQGWRDLEVQWDIEETQCSLREHKEEYKSGTHINGIANGEDVAGSSGIRGVHNNLPRVSIQLNLSQIQAEAIRPSLTT